MMKKLKTLKVYNPFPDIGAVSVDANIKRVLCEIFVEADKLKDDTSKESLT